MKIFENYDLINNNTFGINAKASKFVEYSNDDEIIKFIADNPEMLKSDFLIIGEGSNILFTDDYKGIVIHPATKDISIISEDENYLYIEASAGVVFCDFIEWSINNGAFGIENLSYIPGTVGASAVQNVGAYGAEAKDYIFEVKYLDLDTNEIKILKNAECLFEYRNSIFKNKLKNKTIILSVTFRLSKVFEPNLSYADVRNFFSDNEGKELTAKIIRDAVIEIRTAKLPDHRITGNAGSFFKNPIISKLEFEKLKKEFPDIRFYNHGDNEIKLAAGWLIDQCGLKGYEHKGAAVHYKQALVLINKNNADGKEVLELSKIVCDKVYNTFGVNLEPEVLIL